MKYIQNTALVFVYLEGLLAAIWLVCKLFDVVFDKVLHTLKLLDAFKDFIVGPWWAKQRAKRAE